MRQQVHTMWTRARCAAAAMFFILIVGPAWSADGVVKRKNIDDLTPQELAAYEHAIQIMKDRSAKNPFDKTGYLWQAWVHNCATIWKAKTGKPEHSEDCDLGLPPEPDKYDVANPGMCEHGKDLFLPWHRAEFYYFEKVVQGTDPDGNVTDSRGHRGPSTKNIGIPFWNFTRAPSGNRYPRAFENKLSPLYHDQRVEDPIAPGSYPYTSPFLVGYMINFEDWPEFGGYQKGTRGGYGNFEAITHNPMHSQYIGGLMGAPNTAALDPIFFSFHAYIDLVFEQWIQVHGTDAITSTNFFLRGEQSSQVRAAPGHTQGASKPSMGQVGLYLDIKKLGYEYEVADNDKPMSRTELARVIGLDPLRPPVFGSAASSLVSLLLANGAYRPNPSPAIIRTMNVAVPAPDRISNQQKFFTDLKRNENEPDLSYQMDVYLYPPSATFDPASAPFRKRYLAATGVYWGTGSLRMHDAMPPMQLEITRPMLDLIKSGHGGETWIMSTAITVLPATNFGEPKIIADPPVR